MFAVEPLKCLRRPAPPGTLVRKAAVSHLDPGNGKLSSSARAASTLAALVLDRGVLSKLVLLTKEQVGAILLLRPLFKKKDHCSRQTKRKKKKGQPGELSSIALHPREFRSMGHGSIGRRSQP